MPPRGPSTLTLDERIDALSEEVQELARGVIGLRTEFAEFRGEIRSELRWIKRIGGALTALVLTVVVGSWGVTWEAAKLASDVKQQGRQLEKVENRLDKVENRLDKVDKRLDKVENRLDRVENRLDTMQLQIDKVDKRLDAMQRQLEVIITRLPAKAGV